MEEADRECPQSERTQFHEGMLSQHSLETNGSLLFVYQSKSKNIQIKHINGSAETIGLVIIRFNCYLVFPSRSLRFPDKNLQKTRLINIEYKHPINHSPPNSQSSQSSIIKISRQFPNNIHRYMLKDYHKQKILKTNPNRICYRATKNNLTYFIEEYTVFNVSDENAYKVRSKVAKSGQTVPLIEQFQENGKHYCVSEYVEGTLLGQMEQRQTGTLPLEQALKHYASIVEFISSCHEQMYVLRAIYPHKIRIAKDKLYFYDFTKGLIMKKRKKLFAVLSSPFIAPQEVSEDGYSAEVDTWASGVILFFMITGFYPFEVEGKTNQEIREQFDRKLQKGFKFSQSIEKYGNKLKHLKKNSLLQNIFSQIFTSNPQERISLDTINEYLTQTTKMPMKMAFSTIWQSQHEQSIFYSKMNIKSKWVSFLHKEEVILDFIERSSECLTLECTNIFEEELRYKVHCAVIKMALIKCHNFVDVLYGRIKPFFQVNIQEWESFRKSSSGQEVRKKMEKKEKLLLAAFKAAKSQFKSTNLLFDDSIPKSFNDIKSLYRTQLSSMYRVGCNALKKLSKRHREQRRRLLQSLVRIVIFYLVNRLFTSNEQIQTDFSAYYKWSKYKDFEDLDEWILNEQSRELDEFIIRMVNKYLISNSNQ